METYDPIRLEIFKHLFAAIAEEMGAVLRKSSYSPNIKERRDFSCAVFDTQGNMIAQAAHIPVHLGSMPLSVLAAVKRFTDPGSGRRLESFSMQDSSGTLPKLQGDLEAQEGLYPGDMIVLNDPFRGGTHLPDITLVTPVFIGDDAASSKDVEPRLYGFVASRAHHADVGGMTPGSMPVGREIYQEGLIIPPVKLMRRGKVDKGILELILANVRTTEERAGDLWAQIAANQRGAERLIELVSRYGAEQVSLYMDYLLDYTERMTRRLIGDLPDGHYSFSDRLDNDGIHDRPVSIRVCIRIDGENAQVDFSGSDRQQTGSVNAVYAITLSCVYYVFRSLLGLDVPNNSGCLKPIEVIAPPGTVVNALPPAAVAGGNVETSQRIVDVLLGALAKASPERVPAASQGTMNNVTIGGYDDQKKAPFAYYETIGGGMGARPDSDGPSAVHSHMTNTLNTPIEALEYAYPLRVLRYEVRRGSGGGGKFRGGDGIRRDVQVLVDSQVTLLSERRCFQPYGLNGGEPGGLGENMLIRDGEQIKLPGKGTFDFYAGDVLSIRAPGGGGFGEKIQSKV
ncbi:MAG: hydantoinase B/oxoprolinase family protein [Chloroflexota bacterium]|nr:hydantoinase B/oxoprolinase family protein [Chloroflexota bacterium]